jgi:hypothetical protein
VLLVGMGWMTVWRESGYRAREGETGRGAGAEIGRRRGCARDGVLVRSVLVLVLVLVRLGCRCWLVVGEKVDGESHHRRSWRPKQQTN